MAKKKVEKPKREFTRRQVAQWQQRRKRQRIIFGIGILIIVAVVVVLGVGWYITDYKPMHETVIVVNGTEFDMEYYVKALEFYTGGQSSPWVQAMLDYVEEGIQANELMRQAALELGITVSDAEVEEELKKRELSINRVSVDMVRVELLRDKMDEGYFDEQVPQSAEQRHILAMLLESESQADEVRKRLKGGEDFTELAAELSLDSFTQTEKGDLGWRPEGILPGLLGTSIVEDYAFSAEAGVMSQALYDEEKAKSIGYWLVKVLQRDEDLEEADVQVMLLASREQAEEMRARLEDGEDFAELAKEFSLDDFSKEEGGNLEEIAPGEMGSVVDDFVFNPDVELETLSEPLFDEMAYTTGGYWLVQVLEIDESREIADEDRQTLKAAIEEEWFLALWDDQDNEIESFLDAEKKQWAYLRVIGG